MDKTADPNEILMLKLPRKQMRIVVGMAALGASSIGSMPDVMMPITKLILAGYITNCEDGLASYDTAMMALRNLVDATHPGKSNVG